MKKRMAPIDASFIHMERHESPQHGSVLFVLRTPPGAPPDYMKSLFVRMRQHPVTAAPFNHALSRDWIDRLAPAWAVLPPEQIDLDYHFRHSALPQPGGELELGLLVSRLVTHPLDLSRPPWEIHLIEGLEGGRFAFFMKMHHSLVDGMSVLRMVRNWLCEDPAKSDAPPLWANIPPPRPSASRKREGSAAPPLQRLLHLAKRPLAALPEIAQAMRATVDAARGQGGGLVAPYTAPRSLFNRAISQRRRISTQRLDLKRVQGVAKLMDGTLNDAVALLLGTALRRYLMELDQLPDRALVAGVLVSLHQVMEGTAAEGAANAISMIFADLATETGSIAERAERICRSTGAGKEHLLGLRNRAMAYSTLMLAPYIAGMVSGQGHRLPPFQSVALSNVPGTKVPLYYNGAEVEALHATTIIGSGGALVLTVTSWNRQLCFTFTACPDTVPHSQRLAVYLADALGEVENALGAGSGAVKTRSRKAGAKPAASSNTGGEASA
jgi:diacylglycerol O-acyltransferase / wax synthase